MHRNIVESYQSTRRNQTAVHLKVLLHVVVCVARINKQEIDLILSKQHPRLFKCRFAVRIAS